ncbi:hypothetical protein KR222_011607, partial [Zaprionus bogoriensis]
RDTDPKTARRQTKEARREFLEANSYAELDAAGHYSRECAAQIHDFDIATHDAWVVQCSRGMDVEALLNKRIKMPGRRYVGDYQVRTTTYAQPLEQSLGYVNPKGKYALRRLPLTGHIVVGKRLNLKKPEEEAEQEQEQAEQGQAGINGHSTLPKAAGPQKLKLPVRHPFFGRDYQARIELSKRTAKQLRQADERCLEATARVRAQSNYYSIRSKLLANTQTLQQKEHDVRQSVLTGIAPKFMQQAHSHPDYVDLTNGHNGVEPEQAQSREKSAVKPKKRKANGTAAAAADAAES